MGCETTNARYVVDRMQKQGLIRREPHPTDRRAKRIVLTEGGKGCRGNLLPALAADAPVTMLSPTERAALTELLEKATS
jgi:DNA-binding MarR family transcriptional regulator